MAHKVENVYSMALYRKSLLTPAPGESRPGGTYAGKGEAGSHLDGCLLMLLAPV